MRESDLRELIAKHERDIETIMGKENIDLQDHVVKMLESKLKDINEVLDGKVSYLESQITFMMFAIDLNYYFFLKFLYLVGQLRKRLK